MVTREQILKKLQERKRLAEAEKVAKKPVYTESVKAAEKKVVVKSETNKVEGAPKTLNEAVTRRLKKHGIKENQEFLYRTLAENMNAAQKYFNEATQAGPSVTGVTGQGAGVGLMKTYFDIFFGYFPNLIATEIASTQPIKTEKAMIFYYQTVAGSTKGEVTEGDALITPFKINTDKNFTNYLVNM